MLLPCKLSERRTIVDALLGLSKNLSYLLFAPHSGGTVLMRDVQKTMEHYAKRGAKFDASVDMDTILTVDKVISATGWTRHCARRKMERMPHFRLTRKTILVKRADLERFI